MNWAIAVVFRFEGERRIEGSFLCGLAFGVSLEKLYGIHCKFRIIVLSMEGNYKGAGITRARALNL